MQPALQQNSRAAQLQHLFDFLIDRFQRQDVTLFVANRPVKRTERTILGAEIRVVDVAIDLVSHHARIILRQPELVRLHPNAHQVIGLQHLNRLLFRQSHNRSSDRHIHSSRIATLETRQFS